jgi:hypothetical protein
MPKTPTRNSIEAQLAVHLQDLRTARMDHRQACLALSLAPDDQARQHAVDELEREIKQHSLAIERLEAAREAAVTVDKVAAKADQARQLAELKARREAAFAEGVKHITAAVELMPEIGSHWMQALQSFAGAREATVAAVKLAGGRRALDRTLGSQHDIEGHGPIAAAIGSAVSAALAGGPSLAPVLTITAPLRNYTADDLARALSGLDRRQADAIEAAPRLGQAERITEEIAND